MRHVSDKDLDTLIEGLSQWKRQGMVDPWVLADGSTIEPLDVLIELKLLRGREPMSDKYDKDGRPLSLHEWAALLEDNDYKRVAMDEVGKYQVSTVWLGLDHAFGGPEPLIFETMVFGKGKYSDYQMRYSTLSQAKKGHKKVVKLVKS